MIRENWSGGLYHLTEWIMRLAYLNLLWIAFTLLGGIVFGWTPATIAMYTLMKRWVMGGEQTNLFSAFWDIYRVEFVKSQKIGFILMGIGSLLVIDLTFFLPGETALFVFGKLFALQLLVAYVMMLSYVFTLYVTYDMDCFNLLKKALLLGVRYPLKTIFHLIGSFALIMIFLAVPSLLVFFGGSLFALWCTHHSCKVFQGIA
jgi:uncharacterized membrane protein YesL